MIESSAFAARAKTAMSRTGLSRPVSLALDDDVINSATSILDYGCGRGGDVMRLSSQGLQARGWDPVHAPLALPTPAEVVNLGYVINVIEDPAERIHVLKAAWSFTTKTLIVAARPEWEARGLKATRFGDGWRTTKGTFQKFYGQDELRVWIDRTLDVKSMAAAPGIFYVFRDERDAQQLIASRVRYRIAIPRPRVSEAVFDRHRDLLQPVADFLFERGRLPTENELEEGERTVEIFGSIRSAATVLRRVLPRDTWDKSRQRETDNLRVHLALAAFQGRPRWSHLPGGLQQDVKEFFGSYKAATASADELLFAVAKQDQLDSAIRALDFGKVLPDAVYVHAGYLHRMPPLLRVYEGCARVLVGSIPEATIVKFQRINRRVAYLSYPDFERDPHPALAWSLRADLRNLDMRMRDFSASANPPILHRKDTFVPDTHPSQVRFRRLTAQEERAGLLASPTIGTRDGWERVLHLAGYRLAGHRLCRTQTQLG